MSDLKITLSGQPGSGKTTLAFELAQLLVARGFTVELVDVDQQPTEVVPYLIEHEVRMDALLDRKTTIKIVTVNSPKGTDS